MFDMQHIKYILANAGLIPDILIVGGWLYAAVLVMVVIYYSFFYILKLARRIK